MRKILILISFLISFTALSFTNHENGAVVGSLALDPLLWFDVQSTTKLARPCPTNTTVLGMALTEIEGGCFYDSDKNTDVKSDGVGYKYVTNADYYEGTLANLNTNSPCAVGTFGKIGFLTSTGQYYRCNEPITGTYKWEDVDALYTFKGVYQTSGVITEEVNRGGMVIDVANDEFDSVSDFTYQFGDEQTERLFVGGDNFAIPTLGVAGTNRMIYAGIALASPAIFTGHLDYVDTGDFVLLCTYLLGTDDKIIPSSLKMVPQYALTTKMARSEQNLGFEIDDLVLDTVTGTLQFSASAHAQVQEGTNFTNDPINPHVINFPGHSPVDWIYIDSTSDVLAAFPPATVNAIDTTNWDNAGVPTVTNIANGYCSALGVDSLGNYYFFTPQAEFPSYPDALNNIVNCVGSMANPFPWITVFASLIYQGQLTDIDDQNLRAINYFRGSAGGAVSSIAPPPDSVDWTMFTPQTRADLRNTEALADNAKYIVDDVVNSGDTVPATVGLYLFTYIEGTVGNLKDELWKYDGADWTLAHVPYTGQVVHEKLGTAIVDWHYDGTDWVLSVTKTDIKDQALLLTVGSGSADTASILDIRSTTKGILLPRMTQIQRDAIVTPIAALEIYNTDNNSKDYYDGTKWNSITHSEYYDSTLVDLETNILLL